MRVRKPGSLWMMLTAVGLSAVLAPAAVLGESSVPGTVGNVHLGPVLTLANRGAGIAAVMGSDGHVDLVMARREAQKKGASVRFSYAAVNADALTPEETIATINSDHDFYFDAARAPSGELHLVIDGALYTRTSAGWSTPEEGPACRRILFAANTLVCLLVVSSTDIGSPRRWEWNFFGGPLAAIVLPSHVTTQKLVLTRRVITGWSDWTVIDPETKLDAGRTGLAADNNGVIHVIYIPMSNILGTPSEHYPRYARIDASALSPNMPDTAGSLAATGKLRAVASVTARDIPVSALEIGLAVDPTSGQLLAACWGPCAKGAAPAGFTIDNGTVGTPFPIPSSREFPFAHAYVAPAGKSRFHVVVGVTTGHFKQLSHLSYLTFADGKWSEPVALGEAAGSQGQTSGLQLVSDGGGAAFVTWIDNDDSLPRGRRISLTQ
jgi:hypothetical protein